MCEAWRVAVSRSHDDRARDRRSGDRSLARTVVVFARIVERHRAAPSTTTGARAVSRRELGLTLLGTDFGDARGGVKRARRAGDEVRAIARRTADARTSDSRRRELGSVARGTD